MIYTIESLMAEPMIIAAVIDRLKVTLTDADRIDWMDYLTPKKANPDGTFKTYIGNTTAVTVGSFIDKFSRKPLRTRKSMRKGVGEVGALGEEFQMDNARLEELQVLIDTYNEKNEASVINDIANFLVEDFRESYLAPHKRIDLMLNDLKFSGTAGVDSNVDQKGVKIDSITIPLHKVKPAASYAAKFISYLADQVESLRGEGVDAAVMEMSRATFVKHIVNCPEFQSKFVSKFGSYEFTSGPATPTMVNDLFQALELPLVIRLKAEYVKKQDGVTHNIIPVDKISLLPNGSLGNLRWKNPYELTDKVPGKTYTQQENGLFIATRRTDEGRTTEYGCEWMVDIDKPNRMGLIDCSLMNQS